MKFFEKKAKGEKKQPSAKSALLQTYFASLLSMILCVSMFFATTYAWFTAEVNSTTNEIYIGTLSVGLTKEADPEPLDMANSSNKLFDANIRWEPGYTTVETVHVTNKGDLAFKYSMTFTDGRLNGEVNPKLQEVAQWFDVWVYHDDANTIPTATRYKQIIQPDSGWVNAGSLDLLLAGQPVFMGEMTEVREANQAAGAANAGTTDGKATTATYTIALHMKEDAQITDPAQQLMGQRISLNAKLVAYQMGSEEDAFDNQYDQLVTTAQELEEAFQKGGSIALAADITASQVRTLAEVPKDVEVDLYLNGHSISAELADPTAEESTELFYIHKGGKLTIHGGDESIVHTVAGKSDKRVSALINNCGGSVVINGGTYTMAYGSYAEGYLLPVFVDNNSTSGAATLTVNGGNFTHTRNMFRNFANHGVEVATIIINGGTFNGEASDPGAIWNQKPSAATVAGAGVVEIRGGVFNDMTVCTGFADDANAPAGVILDRGVTLKPWVADGSEWVAELVTPPSP